MSDLNLPLIYHREGAIATIHFNRPAVLNSINAEVAQLFLSACRAAESDPKVRVVILSAEGRGFVAGGDLKLFQSDPLGVPTSLIDPLHEGVRRLATMASPVIASLKGVVAGAGMSLALVCDLAIAAEGTKFNLAYLNVGATCDVSASWSLPRVVGLRKAMEIALLNETLDATEALRLGLVNRVVPAEKLVEQTHALAQRLAAGPALAIANMKRLLRNSLDQTLEQQLAAERQSFQECAATTDFAEAVSAFLEKRPPRYSNK